MSVNSVQQPAPARPRLWWRLVAAAAGLYLVLLASNYVLLWLTGGTLTRTAAQILLIALAAFATAKDLSAARPHRPLRSTERIALISAILLVLLWLTGLLLGPAAPGAQASVLQLLVGLLIAIPLLPIAALTVPGTIVFRRARQPRSHVI